MTVHAAECARARSDRSGQARQRGEWRRAAPRLAAREPHHRHRRPAQRRQVHPVQRPDQERRARGELPVRHDRAERRRRRRARPAAGRARRDLRLREDRARRPCRSSTSPASSRARREGQGLGNKFLANIREADAICQVIRVFTDPDVVHVDGQVAPRDDIETINTELILADLQTIEKALPRLQKEARHAQGPRRRRSPPPRRRSERPRQRHARSSPPASTSSRCASCSLLTAKPFLYVFNVDEDELGDDGAARTSCARWSRPPRRSSSTPRSRPSSSSCADDEALELLQSIGQAGVRARASSPASASPRSACRRT